MPISTVAHILADGISNALVRLQSCDAKRFSRDHVFIVNGSVQGVGTGPSKQQAKEEAAREAFKSMQIVNICQYSEYLLYLYYELIMTALYTQNE